MRRLIVVLISIVFFQHISAQTIPDTVVLPQKDTTYWKKTFKSGVNIAGSAFSDNWKAGGVNNFSYLLFLNYIANYKKDKDSWDNQLDLQFGQIITKSAPEFRKTQDRIFIDSKYGRALNKKWNLYTSFNAQSFFAKGYNYKDRIVPVPNSKFKDTAINISSFINPAYFSQTVGFEYKPVDWYFVRLGVFSAKQTLVTRAFLPNEVEKNYGVERGKSWRNEFGLFNLFAGVNRNVRSNINIKASYQFFFSNIDYLFRRDVVKARFTDKPELQKAYDRVDAYTDHRLDFMLTAKLTKYITASFTYIAIYDYDQDKNTQHSHNLAVGLLYSFQNFIEPPKK